MERLTGSDSVDSISNSVDSISNILLKSGLPIPDLDKKPQSRQEKCLCENCGQEFEAEVVVYNIKKPVPKGENYPGIIQLIDDTHEIRDKLCPGCKLQRQENEQREINNAKRQEYYQIRVDSSNIPEVTQATYRLDTFQSMKGKEASLEVAKRYAFEDPPAHPFLSLAGENGTGKTHLALAIGWHFLENTEITVRYYQAQELLNTLQAGFNLNGNSEKEVHFDVLLKTVKNCGVLIIDDLGTESSSDWSKTMFNSIIDHRYIRQLRTVFTLNVRPDELPKRIASRISEGLLTVVGGIDYRGLKGKRLRGG